MIFKTDYCIYSEVFFCFSKTSTMAEWAHNLKVYCKINNVQDNSLLTLWYIFILKFVFFLTWHKNTRGFFLISLMYIALWIVVAYEECYRFWKMRGWINVTEDKVMSNLDPANLLLMKGIFWFFSSACQLIVVQTKLQFRLSWTPSVC